MTLAELILSRFRGRADYVAVGTGVNAFAPEHRAVSVVDIERDHLAGERCLGFYLLDEASNCWSTTVDFDNKPDKPDPAWRTRAEQLYVALVECGLSPLVEVSQSGEGCHVWLFFAGPTPAWVPRAWWRAIAGRIGTEFREVYPRQDVLTGKGLGNLVRYPLWNKSAFVSPETDWSMIDPAEALRGARAMAPEDLSLLAFEMGLGELQAETRAAVTAVPVGDGESALLPLRVQRLISKSGSLLSRRWNGDTSGMKDESRSALALSICTELVRLYVPTPEVAAGLRYWCRTNGAASKGDRDDWVNLTVTKAYDFVIRRVEAKSADATTMQQAAHAFLDLIEHHAEKPTESGIKELDDSIDGVSPGEVCVIAARPGHGKSAFAFQWLDQAAAHGIAGLVISEEMSAAEIGKRRLLSISSVPAAQWVPASVAVMRREVDDHHAFRSPVYIVESCNTIDRVEEMIDQFCRLYGVGIVAVDYLQLLGGRSTDRYEVVTEMSRRIKQATRRNNCRTLLLSQLNREVEKRPDNEPKMSDLRESGQVEQDADLILFLQYPCKFDTSIPKDQYRIYAAKRRNGPIRTARIETRFDPDHQRFGNSFGQECPI